MKDRKALIVGIDYYERFTPLRGCVADAQSVAQVLEKHENGDLNFQTPRKLLGTDKLTSVDRRQFRDSIVKLFSGKPEIALLYFAGHGYIDAAGGFLCPSDCRDGSDGIPLLEVMNLAKQSGAANKIIILDSCHGGIIGNKQAGSGTTELDPGFTILTASSEVQYAHEGGNGAPGVFTNLLVDALEGAAANLVGDITPGSVYAHIDQSLGPWGGQRPVFKTNVESFVSLRKARPPIALNELRQLPELFPTQNHQFQLDPSFEPERTTDQEADSTFPKPDPTNNAVFATLQNFARVNLVRPVGTKHMWHAAMSSQHCELTTLGKHYRRLVDEGLI
ncbi:MULTISPECIES: caspase family protein [unclassified Rhizobium]|uniref:caspase family protein n=1 Tax=unclassified Rhizobium TaxID=2613769 RepID=UPI001612F6DC|nr:MULTISPECIES: caspase family protein [unclassified Rhizobium]MBB3318714.1 hypothetical protein [Rhizobium sp. BK181]MCS4094909.1 hypothetical protein [Rhizobium sp. BK176]